MVCKEKKIVKNNWQLIVVFIFSFLIYMFLGFYMNNGDPTASYGFGHAIRMGEVPYLDFNTISTPLYAFYCSLFLFIYDDFIMFLFGQVVLITIMFYFLFKMFGNKTWIVFLAMIIFKFMGFSATYNFCCLAMSTIVLYLETKHPSKDFLIGIFLGLAFLSKQTVGGLLFIPSFVICFMDWKRLGRRILGFIIPNLILVIYLIYNNALYEFIDLCFLGILDFGGNNNVLFTFWFFLAIILLIINIILIIREGKITDYYGLSYFGFLIPIFDLNHFAYYFVGITIILLNHIGNLSRCKNILIAAVIIEFTLFNTFMGIREYKALFYEDVNHFKFKYNYSLDYQRNLRYNAYIENYIDKNPILIMYYSMEYNIINDRKIGYFDIFLYGNHGYNGTLKMINRIKSMRNQYFIISMEEYKAAKVSDSQFNDEIIDYIISVSKLVDQYEEINVYYKE